MSHVMCHIFLLLFLDKVWKLMEAFFLSGLNTGIARKAQLFEKLLAMPNYEIKIIHIHVISQKLSYRSMNILLFNC